MNTKELEKLKRDKACRAAQSGNSDEGGQGLQRALFLHFFFREWRVPCQLRHWVGELYPIWVKESGAQSLQSETFAQGNHSTGLLRSVWYQSISIKYQDSIYSIHLTDSICQKIGLARPKIGSELWEVIHQVAFACFRYAHGHIMHGNHDDHAVGTCVSGGSKTLSSEVQSATQTETTPPKISKTKQFKCFSFARPQAI